MVEWNIKEKNIFEEGRIKNEKKDEDEIFNFLSKIVTGCKI